MKIKMQRVAAAFLCAAFLTSGAAAFTMEEVKPEDIFTPEVMEQEKISNWALDEVRQAIDLGLVPEQLGRGFQKEITRAQFCELVANMVEKATGKPLAVPASNSFTDTSNEWVLKANGAGIVNGTSATTFEPSANITREQIAAMFYRAITYIQQETGREALAAGGDLAAYTDAGQVSGWAKEAVAALARSGIMKGTSDSRLSPQETATVEQAILLVLRVYQTVTGI